MTRFLILPVCFKDLMLGLLRVDFSFYFISSLFANLFFRLEMFIVFINVEDIEKEESHRHMSFVDIIGTFIHSGYILISVLVTSLVIFYVTKKLNNKSVFKKTLETENLF